MSNRPTTYAKHAGRATALEGQLDLLGGAEPVPMKRKQRKRKPGGHEAGRIGMQRAAERAEREQPGWEELAIEAVRQCVLAMPAGTEFIIENVRARLDGILPPPTELRAWGSATRALRRLNIIERVPGKVAPAMSSNGTEKPVYRRGAGA